MGTYASAEAFYGISWDADERPEKWAKEAEARYEAGDYETEFDLYEELEQLLKELGVDALLEVDCHGNLAYGYTGYAVHIRGTDHRFSIGGPERVPLEPEVSAEALAAISKVVEHLGEEGATIGWQIAVSYG